MNELLRVLAVIIVGLLIGGLIGHYWVGLAIFAVSHYGFSYAIRLCKDFPGHG
jgi:hypothetical protein